MNEMTHETNAITKSAFSMNQCEQWREAKKYEARGL